VFVQRVPDMTIMTLSDEEILEEGCIKEIEAEIMLVVNQAKHLNLTVDFCNVNFMSSAFLGLLVKVHKKICERKGRLRLCNVNPNLYKVFEITQLNKVLDISQQ